MKEFIRSDTNTRIRNYKGMKKNMLTAISFSHSYNGIVFWNFKCDCGGENKIRPCKVFSKNSHTKSCGCLKGIKNENHALTKLLRSYMKGAVIRGFKFELSREDFLIITSKSCYYCKIEPKNIIKSTYHEYIYNGIDRKDNKIGYNLSNSLPCCTLCNKAKRDLEFNVFINWINRFKKIKN